MLSISRRDGIFIFLAFAFSIFAIGGLITLFAGPALGAPTMVEKANVYLLVGIVMTTLVAFFVTRWIRRDEPGALRGAIGGAATVFISVITGVLIFDATYGPVGEFEYLMVLTAAGLAFVPVGMVAGAITYGFHRRR